MRVRGCKARAPRVPLRLQCLEAQVHGDQSRQNTGRLAARGAAGGRGNQGQRPHLRSTNSTWLIVINAVPAVL